MINCLNQLRDFALGLGEGLGEFLFTTYQAGVVLHVFIGLAFNGADIAADDGKFTKLFFVGVQ